MFKIIIVICALCANVIAQLNLRKGMLNKDVDSISFSKLIEIFSSIYIWLGLFFYVISFVLYLYILSKFEVSYIYPIIMSVGFILLLIFSVLFLNEAFTFNKILGIILISCGIIILAFK